MSAGGAGEGAQSQLTWLEDDEFAIDGIEYALRPIDGMFESTAERFCLCKPAHLVRRYERLLRESAPRTIVEVGIYGGGSTAFFAQLARPDRLVCFDIEPARSGLEEMISSRGLGSVVHPHWEVDQADGARLREIVAAEVGGRALDLVIDDASHLLEPTRATFNALFPLLRPGGTYVIEDWAWAHAITNPRARHMPLTILIFELIMAAGHRPEAVERVDVDRPWAVVTRGPRELDPSFDVLEHCGVRGRKLLPPAGAGAEPAPGARRGSLWSTARSQLRRLRGGADTR